MGSRKKEKRRSKPRDLAVVKKLDTVERYRRPFEPLARQIISDTAARFAAPSAGLIVEIGAGNGQLRSYLPQSSWPRLIHTEPLDLAISGFRKRWPEAEIRRAGAEALPFEEGSVDSVIGLCVLDVVDDGVAVAQEIRRVLRPGGHVIHWLDLSTELRTAFTLLRSGSVIPLPNVFFDPSEARWPEDLMLLPTAQLELILEVLQRRAHPLAHPLRQYLRVFTQAPFDVRRAIAEYTQLSEQPQLRVALKLLFKVAYELAEPKLRAELSEYRGQPASSARFFQTRLANWFSSERGFEVVFSDLITGALAQPKEASSPFGYRSLCVGEFRELPRVPAARLDAVAIDPDDDQALLELGIFTFVARRC